MKALASIASIALVSVIWVDGWTNTTQRYLSGQLDSRLVELGTQLQTGEFIPLWTLRQTEGVKLHCARTLHAQSKQDPKCGSKTAWKSHK